jgi:hypothetical protein
LNLKFTGRGQGERFDCSSVHLLSQRAVWTVTD